MSASDIDGHGDDDEDDGKKKRSMKIRVFKGPFCENVLQILDRTPPKPRF